MICRLKHDIVDWSNLNVFYKGTVMETVEIFDQNVHLINIRNTNKRLKLALEEFVNRDLVEILEGGV